MSIMIGVALSATCGFRVFVPLLAVNIGTRALDADGQPRIELAGGFDWLSSDIALIVFLVATLFEIGGYYIPWIDNLLDTIATAGVDRGRDGYHGFVRYWHGSVAAMAARRDRRRWRGRGGAGDNRGGARRFDRDNRRLGQSHRGLGRDERRLSRLGAFDRRGEICHRCVCAAAWEWCLDLVAPPPS